jgi:hypothetical protein
VSDIGWRALKKDEYEQLVNQFESECIRIENIGFVILAEGAILPAIKIERRLFRKLAKFGSIDNISRIDAPTVGLHFYAKLQIEWPPINENLKVVFKGWRDRGWLESLCEAKKVALTTEDFKIVSSIGEAVVVDGLNVDRLWLTLITTSMSLPPKDFLI